MEFNWSEEIYNDEPGTRVPENPEDEILQAVPILSEEVYDDDLDDWTEEDEEDGPGPASMDLLKGLEAPLSAGRAFDLCATAILNYSSSRDFHAILDFCPPLPDFLNVKAVDFSIPNVYGYPGLVELAAYLGQAKLLDLLLRRGGNVNVRPTPNTSGAFPISPLEAAVWGGSMECVERLLAEPTLDLSFSAQLQRLWARPSLDSDQRRCLQHVAPLTAGMEFPDAGPVPIPEKFFPAVAIEMDNQELFLRLCQERGRLTTEEAKPALGMLWVAATLMDRNDPPDMLLALLDLFPEALNLEAGPALLALAAVNYPYDLRLEPWLKKLRNIPIQVIIALLDEHFTGWELTGVNTRRLRTRMGGS